MPLLFFFFFPHLRRDPFSLPGMFGNCIIRKLKIMYGKQQFHRRCPSLATLGCESHLLHWEPSWLKTAVSIGHCLSEQPGFARVWCSTAEVRPSSPTADSASVLWVEIYCTLRLFRMCYNADQNPAQCSWVSWCKEQWYKSKSECPHLCLTASRSPLYQQECFYS